MQQEAEHGHPSEVLNIWVDITMSSVCSCKDRSSRSESWLNETKLGVCPQSWGKHPHLPWTSAEWSLNLRVLDFCWKGFMFQTLFLLCRNPGEDTKMLVCDMCDKGYHTFCLQPAIDSLPTNGWRCKVGQPWQMGNLELCSWK